MRLDAFSFDWVLLRSFLSVYRYGSLVAAARSLSLQQSTLSRHLEKLEESIGESLFERTGRGLLATETAGVVAQHAVQIEGTVNAMALALTAKASTLHGTVRISADNVFSTYLLPPIIEELVGLHPGLHLELVASNDVPSLLNRATDIALRLNAPQEMNVVARKIGDIPHVAVAHERYLEMMGVPDLVSDLLHHQLLGVDTDATMNQIPKMLGLQARNDCFRLRTNDSAVNVKLLNAAIGIGFIPQFVLDVNPQLRQVLPGLLLPKLPCWLTTHSEISSNPLIRVVYDKLAERLVEKLGVTEH